MDLEKKQILARERRAQLLEQRVMLAALAMVRELHKAEIAKQRISRKKVLGGAKLKTKTQKALEKVEQERRRKQKIIERQVALSRRAKQRAKAEKKTLKRGTNAGTRNCFVASGAPLEISLGSGGSASSNRVNFLESDSKTNSNASRSLGVCSVTSTGDIDG